MRSLLVILLFPFLCQAQAQDAWLSNDKIQHWTTSTVMSFTAGQIIEHTTGWEYSHEAALFGVIVLGTFKEYKMDDSASGKDIAFNAAGAIVGYYVNRTLNKKINKLRNAIK